MAALTKHGGSSKIHPTVVETQSLQSAQCSASEDAANTIPEGAVQRALDGLAHDRERAHAVKKNAVGLLIEMVNLWFKRSASNTEKPLFAFTQWTMAGCARMLCCMHSWYSLLLRKHVHAYTI